MNISINALNRLTDTPQSTWDIRCSLSVLYTLCAEGLAHKVIENGTKKFVISDKGRDFREANQCV